MPRRSAVMAALALTPGAAADLFLVPRGTAGAHDVPGADYGLLVHDAGRTEAGWEPFATDGVPPGADRYLVCRPTCGPRVNVSAAARGGRAWPLPGTGHAVVVAAYDAAAVVSRDSGRAPALLRAAPRRSAAAPPPGPVRVAPRAEKEGLMAAITVAGAEHLLRGLSGADPVNTTADGTFTLSTRMSTSNDNLRAARWIGEWLLGHAGCDDLQYEEFRVSGSLTRNVICVKNGRPGPTQHEVVVVGAHFDSIPSSGTAPGASDNGSGTVSVMMIAKALLAQAFERTIHFVLFSGEEQGLHGSRHYVEQALARGQVMPGALIVDMTSWSLDYFGVIFEGAHDPAIAAMMTNAQHNLDALKATLGSRMTSQHNHASWGSDHIPFQQAGIASILHIEQDCINSPHYHQATDTVAYATWDQMRDIARVILGQTLDYAGLVIAPSSS